MNVCLTVIVSALIIINFAHYITCLKCITCGKYNTKDAGSIIPCSSGSNTYGEMTTCKNNEQYCMKYFNEGVTVRQCMETCTETTTTDSSIYCCQEDGCNNGFSTKPTISVLFFTIITLLLAFHLLLWIMQNQFIHYIYLFCTFSRNNDKNNTFYLFQMHVRGIFQITKMHINFLKKQIRLLTLYNSYTWKLCINFVCKN